MTSAINAGTINVNYPTPGVNNSTQGMRDNFTGTKDNLQIAADEITDLQNKSILKEALNGKILNNDMSNGIIKNVQTLGFRSSTYNLGTNITSLNIDLTLGDVQYGELVGNTTVLSFSKWAPTNTMSSVQVIFNNLTPGQKIQLPPNVTLGFNTIEGLSSLIITVPNGVTRLHYQFNSTDCGETIEIVPIDRSRQSTQLITGIPSTGNVLLTGTITASTTNTNVTGVSTNFIDELVVGRVILSSPTDAIIGIVQSIQSATSLTLVANSLLNLPAGSPAKQISPIGNIGDVEGNFKTDGNYLYVCAANYDGTTAIWKRTLLNSY